MVIKDKLPRFIYEEVKLVGLEWFSADNWLGSEILIGGKAIQMLNINETFILKKRILRNTLNAVGSLLISIIYYKYTFLKKLGQEITFKDTADSEPKSILRNLEMNSILLPAQLLSEI